MEQSSTKIPTLINATQMIADFAQKSMSYSMDIMTSTTANVLPFLHDSFYLFGLALNESLKKKTKINDGITLINQVKCKNFTGKNLSLIIRKSLVLLNTVKLRRSIRCFLIACNIWGTQNTF